FLRGIAIIMMVIYHIMFDVVFLNISYIDLSSIPVLLFLYPIGTMFLLLVGVSLTLSYSRTEGTLSSWERQRKFIIRGLYIFGGGLLVTLGTWLYLKQGYVIFGVLHCIGVSTILVYPLIKQRVYPLILGILCVLIGVFLQLTVVVDFPWLLWLGLIPNNFYTVDYFPLLPWLGVILIGIFLGNRLYQNNQRRFRIKDLSQMVVVRGMCFLGRHSLLIYLLHQPIIVALLTLFF
ncbi:MAG TPA: heparan-alpha-glucosaminide N-acetyltransferase, partial [Candidatus Thermoplasmatota archaeon]|nr:heparan-alpha-glucosaminide N-acetyltransferase [Candidatus Thermoplasmatota archaeon]